METVVIDLNDPKELLEQALQHWVDRTPVKHKATMEEARRYAGLFGDKVVRVKFIIVRRAFERLGYTRMRVWKQSGLLSDNFLLCTMGDSRFMCAPNSLEVMDRLLCCEPENNYELMNMHRMCVNQNSWGLSPEEAAQFFSAIKEAVPEAAPFYRVLNYLNYREGSRGWVTAGFSPEEFCLLVRLGYSYKAPAAAKKLLDGYLKKGCTRKEALCGIELARLFGGRLTDG